MRPKHALILLLLAGCSERRFAGPPPPDNAPLAVEGDASAPASELVGDAGAGGITWIDAVRLERWAEAASLLDALPESARARADIRYVRARAAVGAGDGATALHLLEGLDAALPLLGADVARWRAEAQLLVGPYAPAAAYFAQSRGAKDLLRAAAAYQKAGDASAARATADRGVLVASHAKSGHEEAAARLARAEVLRALGGDDRAAAAEADLRWVATHAAATSEGRRATDALDRMKKPLTPHERVIAAEPAQPAAPLEGPSAKPAPAASKPVLRGEAQHARAMTLYKNREYAAAAVAFREAAASGSGHEPEDLHYAARALSRADHDADAVKAYHAMAARYPRSPFAERSEYYAARLELLMGHFREAAEAYSKYLTTFRKIEHRDEAEYERALAWLSSGSADQARSSLSALARRAGDDRAPRLRELVGVAEDRLGDRSAAIKTWTEIAKSQPLTWAALTARARLASAGAPVPPLMDPQPETVRQGLELRLPAASALLASVGLDGDAESYLSAAEREASAGYAGREGEALCGLYGMLSRAKRRYRVGINAVDGAVLLRTPSPAERWAWDCVYPRPFAFGVRALEAEHHLPGGLVYAVMRQESAFDPAIVSPAAAVGLMQLIPSTAKAAAAELALPFEEADLTRPDVNLRLGAYYIAKLLRMFEGNVALAAAAYNAGPRAVSHWVEASPSDDLDLWVARIPFDETRNYVARVAQNLARYQWLEGGEAAVTPLALVLPSDARAPADAY